MSSAANRQMNNPEATRQKPFPKPDTTRGSGQVVNSSVGGSGRVDPSRSATVTSPTVGGRGVRDTGSRGKSISTK